MKQVTVSVMNTHGLAAEKFGNWHVSESITLLTNMVAIHDYTFAWEIRRLLTVHSEQKLEILLEELYDVVVTTGKFQL